ncbi:hypothetical protein DVH24_013401 [Malus domestica]|uniref:F-box associated domain-containing protein n=1 Tax=Malus domestica TaxID=3750 RepID=A0A498HM93_MALDO|nr:hypothetical protein DVH24_013401 [Malus domestica]
MHEYGTSDSWTLLYSIGVETGPETVPWWFDHCEPLGFSKNGEMVLLKKGEGALIWFDLEQKNNNQVYSGGLPHLFKATICLGTLSLLDGDSVVSKEEKCQTSHRRYCSTSFHAFTASVQGLASVPLHFFSLGRFIKAHLQRSIQTNSGCTILLKSRNAPPSDFLSSPFDDSETFGTAVKIEQPLKCPDDSTTRLGCSTNGVVCICNYETMFIA